MFYVEFSSGSMNFINWVRGEMQKRLKIKGHVTSSKNKNPCYHLKYAKYEAIKLVKEIYRNKKGIYLKRKKLKINQSLITIGLPQMK